MLIPKLDPCVSLLQDLGNIVEEEGRNNVKAEGWRGVLSKAML